MNISRRNINDDKNAPSQIQTKRQHKLDMTSLDVNLYKSRLVVMECVSVNFFAAFLEPTYKTVERVQAAY